MVGGMRACGGGPARAAGPLAAPAEVFAHAPCHVAKRALRDEERRREREQAGVRRLERGGLGDGAEKREYGEERRDGCGADERVEGFAEEALEKQPERPHAAHYEHHAEQLRELITRVGAGLASARRAE